MKMIRKTLENIPVPVKDRLPGVRPDKLKGGVYIAGTHAEGSIWSGGVLLSGWSCDSGYMADLTGAGTTGSCRSNGEKENGEGDIGGIDSNGREASKARRSALTMALLSEYVFVVD
jgi:hypothetical protein